MSGLSVLVYRRSDAEGPWPDRLVPVFSAEGGLDLQGVVGARYRSGRWTDAATGAWAEVDCGRPPLEDDPLSDERCPEGWQPAAQVLIPLGVPHWYAWEAAAWLARRVAADEGLGVLLAEEMALYEQPAAVDIERLLLLWRQLHISQTRSLQRFLRLGASSSAALWQYRRQRTVGEAARPDLHWPEVSVLRSGNSGLTICLWADAGKALALPPVSAVVIPRTAGAVVVPVTALAALLGDELPWGGARILAVTPATQYCHAHADGTPAVAMQLLGDGEWGD